MHFDGIAHYDQSIWGYLYFRKPPNDCGCRYKLVSKFVSKVGANNSNFTMVYSRYLVGGSNPSKHYESVWMIIPNIWNKQIRNVPNHQPSPTKYIYTIPYGLPQRGHHPTTHRTWVASPATVDDPEIRFSWMLCGGIYFIDLRWVDFSWENLKRKQARFSH